jgi:hypothetical protein
MQTLHTQAGGLFGTSSGGEALQDLRLPAPSRKKCSIQAWISAGFKPAWLMHGFLTRNHEWERQHHGHPRAEPLQMAR